MAAYCEILTETAKTIQSMKPVLESVDKIGSALREEEDAVRRTPAASAVHNLHSKEIRVFSDCIRENASSIIFCVMQ